MSPPSHRRSPPPKRPSLTCTSNTFTTFRHVDFLKKYHSKEHRWNLFKYRRQQKARCEGVRRVKGEDGVGKQKSQIIVTFGNGKFGNSGRNGSRGAPVERFKKHLSRNVTLVVVDEYRTSRACSKCWLKDCWGETGDTSNTVWRMLTTRMMRILRWTKWKLLREKEKRKKTTLYQKNKKNW